MYTTPIRVDTYVSVLPYYIPTYNRLLKLQLNSVYRRHEKEKQRSYEQRIREVERGSFTQLVFSTSGNTIQYNAIQYNGRPGCNSLQEASLSALPQARIAIQHSHDMAAMPPVVLTAEIRSQMPESRKVKHWICCTSRGLSRLRRTCIPSLNMHVV